MQRGRPEESHRESLVPRLISRAANTPTMVKHPRGLLGPTPHQQETSLRQRHALHHINREQASSSNMLSIPLQCECPSSTQPGSRAMRPSVSDLQMMRTWIQAHLEGHEYTNQGSASPTALGPVLVLAIDPLAAVGKARQAHHQQRHAARRNSDGSRQQILGVLEVILHSQRTNANHGGGCLSWWPQC